MRILRPAPRPARFSSWFRLIAFPLAGTLVLAAGCGDKSTGPPPVPEARVVVAPSAATVIVHGTLNLTATAENLGDPAVRWSVLRMTPTPDTVSLGSIVATGPTTATYTAPDRVVSLLDYKILITATSLADTNVRGTATIVVPRVIVRVIPSSVASVPPGTLVPYQVSVHNSPDRGFTLYVGDIEGGDENSGTWTQTGEQTTVYQAPDAFGTSSTLDLLAVSTEDPARFGTSIVTVRRGFPLPISKPELSQYAPAWHPTQQKLAYVQGGPPWEVAIRDFAQGTEQTLATFSWSGSEYDGRLDWSSSGAWLAFSEETGSGRRTIGVVPGAGGERFFFAPSDAADYLEAAFVPRLTTGLPESLVVAQETGGASSLRAYPMISAAGDPGRPVLAAPSGFTARWPDVARIELGNGNWALHVACELSDGSRSDVLSLVDDGGTGSSITVAGGAGRRTQVRWAQQLAGPLWITYIWDANGTVYRVRRQGYPAAARVYSEFFPELGTDLTIVWGRDDHAISRRLPSGTARIWVVEFPPQSFDGVPLREERELASIGVPGALSPSGWGRWLGTYQPVIGRGATGVLRGR